LGDSGEKITKLALALLFFLSAALQYNDPDPVRWIAVYMGGAIACLIGLTHPRSWIVPGLVGAGALVWAVAMADVVPRIAFGDLFESMKAETPRIEESREFLGLVIVVSGMAWLTLRALRNRAGGPS
jgi:hypothetical protein